MSRCPSGVELQLLLDGELTRNDEVAVRAHLDGCAACRGEVANLEVLLADLRAPLSAAAADPVARVMARLEAAPAPAAMRRHRYAWTVGVALACAAALAVMMGGAGWRLRAPARPALGGAEFAARGGSQPPSLARQVGIRIHAGSGAPPLESGAVLPADAPLSASYRNLFEHRPVYLMLFGVDAAGAVHWLYPAYTDARTDPVGLRLPHSSREATLPDSVVLEAPALGPMWLFALVSFEPLRVSAIERLEGGVDLERLRHTWPAAQVDEIKVRLRAPGKVAR